MITSNSARRITSGSTLPANPTPGRVFMKTSGGSEGMHICFSAGIWLLVEANTGAGTVTSVSVTTANGVSGVVANPTTTPAITFTLGAITPSSIVSPGNITSGATGVATGAFLLKGTTSGTVTVKSADAAGTWSLTLPANDGDAGQFLQTDGAGVSSWQTVTAGITNSAGANVIPKSDGTNLVASPLSAPDANTVEQRNSATPQNAYVYGTYTSATDHERLNIGWDAAKGYFSIGPQKGSGGGSARMLDITSLFGVSIRIGNDVVGYWEFNGGNGDLYPTASGHIGNIVHYVPAFLGALGIERTITAPGTTGAQTINKTAGSVNFAGGASSLVVTNSLVTADSIVIATVQTNDATAIVKNVVPASGSFTITLNAAAGAETRVGFIVLN